MKKVMIKGKTFKDFDIEIIEPNYAERKHLSVLIHQMQTTEYVKEKGHLFYCYDIAQIITGLSDESINKYSDEQIIAIAVKAMEELTEKKLMK